jgi:hypothetical protein
MDSDQIRKLKQAENASNLASAKPLFAHAQASLSTSLPAPSHVNSAITPLKSTLSVRAIQEQFAASPPPYEKLNESICRRLEMSISFPRISDWLAELDADPKRGDNRAKFASFAPHFERERIFRVNELVDDWKQEEIQDILQCKDGRVKRLWSFANQDVGILRDKAARQYYLQKTEGQ